MKEKDDTNINITKEQKLKELTDKWWKLVLEQVKTWHLVDSDKLKIASIPLSDDKQIELDELEENIESISFQLGIRPPFERLKTHVNTKSGMQQSVNISGSNGVSVIQTGNISGSDVFISGGSVIRRR